MNKVFAIVRNTLALVGVPALGYWLGSERLVKAASIDVAFQMVDVKETARCSSTSLRPGASIYIVGQPPATLLCNAASSTYWIRPAGLSNESLARCNRCLLTKRYGTHER